MEYMKHIFFGPTESSLAEVDILQDLMLFVLQHCDKIVKEVEILKRLSHRHVVDFIRTYPSHDKGFLIIVMEYVPGVRCAIIYK